MSRASAQRAGTLRVVHTKDSYKEAFAAPRYRHRRAPTDAPTTASHADRARLAWRLLRTTAYGGVVRALEPSLRASQRRAAWGPALLLAAHSAERAPSNQGPRMASRIRSTYNSCMLARAATLRDMVHTTQNHSSPSPSPRACLAAYAVLARPPPRRRLAAMRCLRERPRRRPSRLARSLLERYRERRARRLGHRRRRRLRWGLGGHGRVAPTRLAPNLDAHHRAIAKVV